jgi:hypothetical protein
MSRSSFKIGQEIPSGRVEPELGQLANSVRDALRSAGFKVNLSSDTSDSGDGNISLKICQISRNAQGITLEGEHPLRLAGAFWEAMKPFQESPDWARLKFQSGGSQDARIAGIDAPVVLWSGLPAAG